MLAVMQVRVYHILPEIHYDFSSDPTGQIVNTPVDSATQEYAHQSNIGDAYRLGPQESFQPPLYYTLAALVSLPFPANPGTVLYLSRLVTAAFGGAMIYFCWAAVRQIAPGRPQWAVGAAGAIALLPQFCFNSSSVSNDSAVNCLAAASYYVWLHGLRDPTYDPRLLRAGALLGLAWLAKANALELIPGLTLVLLFRAFQVQHSVDRMSARLRRGLVLAAGAATSAAAVGGWLVVRNLFVYGEPTGLRDAGRFNAGKLPWFDFHDPNVQANFLQSAWESFWGVFGWFDQLLPPYLYEQARTLTVLLLGLTGLAALLLLGRVVLRRYTIPHYSWQAACVLATVAGVVIGSFLWINVKVDFQPQGRYLFLFLLPASLLWTAGLAALPGRLLRGLALSVPIIWLAMMNLVGILVVR
ncbi:MAG: DUF2142 domain-containing protein [Actinomycetota bacterium]|nr:DUF2142 domain-containing protein [Actinomycetota bacterium]